MCEIIICSALSTEGA